MCMHEYTTIYGVHMCTNYPLSHLLNYVGFDIAQLLHNGKFLNIQQWHGDMDILVIDTHSFAHASTVAIFYFIQCSMWRTVSPLKNARKKTPQKSKIATLQIECSRYPPSKILRNEKQKPPSIGSQRPKHLNPSKADRSTPCGVTF